MDDPPAAHPRSSSGVAEITVDDAALVAEPAGDDGLLRVPDEGAGAVGRLADPDEQLATEPPLAGTPPGTPSSTPPAAETGKPRAKPAVKTAAKAPARGRRTSVPTWDDIMFGAKRD
jgi:hypothetical protein